jgi:hypothetical protein
MGDRQVLECGSPLPLWIGWKMRRWQRSVRISRAIPCPIYYPGSFTVQEVKDGGVKDAEPRGSRNRESTRIDANGAAV